MSEGPRIEWKDDTSYPRGERGKHPPTTFGVQSGAVRLVVTCGHINYPGEWIMHGYGIGIDTEPLGIPGDDPAGKAMAEAERVAMRRVQRLQRAVEAILEARGCKP